MITNHIKTAWRSIIRNRTYSLINAVGLSLGLGVAIVIFCIVRFERSFDTFHSNRDRLYKIISHDIFGELNTHVPQGVIKALHEQFPGVASAATVYRFDPSVIRVDDKNFKQENAYFVPPEFFKMIDAEWIDGSPETSLTKPYQVVLDETTAQRLFRGDAMGKTIRYANEIDLTVSGIIKDSPPNSDFQFQMIVSYETLGKYMTWLANEDYWSGGDSGYQGFVLLEPDADPRIVEAGLENLIKPHTAKGRSHYTTFTLLPLSDVHFDSVTGENFNYATPLWLLYVLTGAGVFLIAIACINFINIAVVQAIQRNKETGVRKILGGSKKQLVAGFLVETAIVTVLSLFMGRILADLLLPHAGNLLNTHVAMANNWDLETWLFMAITALSVIVLSGVYPALVISRFKPVELLRARLSAPDSRGFSLRKSLVVVQFVIAQLLVAATLIGTSQVNFLNNKELGFDQASVVTVSFPESGSLLRERFREALVRHPAVDDVTFGLTTPSSLHNWWWGQVKYPGLQNGEQQFRQQYVDTSYFRFFHISLLTGRGFTIADSARSVAMINERAAHDMGFRAVQDAIGSRVEMWGDTYEITGVVKDYHSQSLRDVIKPHIYFYNGRFSTAAIRVAPTRKEAALAHIEQEWKSLFPNYYFEYRFLDEDLRSFYDTENKFAGILSLFSVVSLVISCLGIFGLVSFVCQRKSKEIGIRKVLGATVAGIVALLSSDFLKLVLIAVVIASPVAWLAMSKWLEGFAYQIEIQWWMFAVAGLVALVVALLTVGWQATRAAVANPVDSLKDE